MIPKPSSPASKFPDIKSAIAAHIQQFKEAESQDVFRRVLLVGDSGSGKTYTTCLTAPVPMYVIDVDGQMANVRERDGLFRLGLVNDSDARKVAPQAKTIFEALEIFFLNQAKDIVKDCGTVVPTFVIDSISTVGDSLMRQLEKDPQALANSFWLWKEWGNRWRDLITSIRMLKANVVAIAHEQPEYDSSTPPKLIGYRWYLPGNMFSPRLASFFTDAVLQLRVANTKPIELKSVAFPSAGAGPNIATEQKFLWQIYPEQKRPWIKSRCSSKQQVIPADWNELVK